MIDEHTYHLALSQAVAEEKTCGCGPDCDCGPACPCGADSKCAPACTCGD